MSIFCIEHSITSTRYLDSKHLKEIFFVCFLYKTCLVRSVTQKYNLPTLLEDDVFFLRSNEVLFHVHILDDLTNIYESTKEGVQEEHDKHAALRMMKVPLKQFYLEFCYSRTRYVRMCVCIYSHYLMQKNSWSMMMVLDDIKAQIIMNLCKCLIYSAPGSTTRTMALCALKLESFFHKLLILYCFSSLIKTSSYII